MTKSYYFDYNATTPVAPEVFQAMQPFLTQHFGNPSSLHHLARIPAKAIRDARRSVAALLGATDETEILFTSCGTESNNAAIRSCLALSGKKQIVTSKVEHSSISKLCRQLEKEGYVIREVGVDSQGRLDLAELAEAVSVETAVVSLMWANNETGVLFPIERISPLLKERGIFFHVDAVQAVGKLPVDLKHTAVDFLSLSGHKLYAPKGVGALYIRKGKPFQPFICGGGQERGRRAGTENVANIVALGAASELVKNGMEKEIERLSSLRDRFEKAICEQNEGVFVNGGKAERLSNTINFRFNDVDPEAFLIALDQRGICASNGSACMSGSPEPSRVLKAMGCTDAQANSAVRFSFGRFTIEQEIDAAIPIVHEELERLRKLEVRK